MATAIRRAAGLIMIRVDADNWSDPEYRNSAYGLIDQGIGGIGVFAGSLEETAVMIEDLQRRAGRRLIVAADYEFGLPMRLRGGVAFPRAMALGRGSVETTELVAACIAEEARAIGVHWNWAPVCDINSNPKNPIINTRSFGEDAKTVSEHAVAYIKGTQRWNVIACAKHLPGHGDTTADSHVSMPAVSAPQHVMEMREYVPFRSAIDAGVRSVMVGHLDVPFLDPGVPASLSTSIITNMVRKEWGFTGLVVTDALDMKAIADQYSSGEAAVAAVLAGCDVVLMPTHPSEAIEALANAIEQGIISDESLAEHEARWEDARRFVGLRTAANPGGSREAAVPVDQSHHALQALRAAQAALGIEGNMGLLPLTEHSHIAVFCVVDEADEMDATTWCQQLAQATEVNMDMGFIDSSITDEEVEQLRHGVADAVCVVAAIFGKAVAYRGLAPERAHIPQALRKLAGSRPLIVVVCGSPYGITDVQADLTIHTYSETLPSLAASVLTLVGRSVSSN